MSASIDVTTLDRVKACGLLSMDHGKAGTGTKYDAQLSAIISEVSSMMEAYLGREFLTKDRDEEYDIAQDESQVYLANYPVESVTMLLYRPNFTCDWQTESTEVQTPLYHLDAKIGQITGAGLFPPGKATVRCIYRGGFASSQSELQTLFPDIVSAADRQVGHHWRRSRNPDKSAVQVAGGSTQYDAPLGLLKATRDVLDIYKGARV